MSNNDKITTDAVEILHKRYNIKKHSKFSMFCGVKIERYMYLVREWLKKVKSVNKQRQNN